MESSPYLDLDLDLIDIPVDDKPTGYVYFVEREGLIKIGYTTDVGTRLHSIGKGNAMPPGMTVGPVTLRAVVPGSVVDEKRYHRRFVALRITGTEWFHPDDELRRTIFEVAARHGGAIPPRRPVVRGVSTEVLSDTSGPVALRELAGVLGISFGALHQQVTAGRVPVFTLSDRHGAPLYVDATIAEQVRTWHAANRFRPWPRFPLDTA